MLYLTLKHSKAHYIELFRLKGKYIITHNSYLLKVRIKLTMSVHYSESSEVGLEKDFNLAEPLPL